MVRILGVRSSYAIQRHRSRFFGRFDASFLWIAGMSLTLIAISGCDLVQDADKVTDEVLPDGVSAASGYFGNPTGGSGSGQGQSTSATGRSVGAPVRPVTSMRPVDLAGSPKPPARTQQTILIASFNIQAFGEKKVSDPVVVDRIVNILRLFDVTAIQEVRANDQTVLPRLIQLVNSQGAKYDYILGPRLGRSNSKEQYCYVYDTNRILSSPSASYTVKDNADLLHREPLVEIGRAHV